MLADLLTSKANTLKRFMMKRGATLSSRNEKQSIQESPFAELLPELIGVVASFLPAYSFIDEQSVKFINKKWLSQLHNHQPSLQSLMASCQTSDDSLNILKNTTLLNKIPYKELLIITSKHPLLLKSILPMLNSEELCLVGKQSIETARHILTTQALARKIRVSDACDLRGYHLELATEFLSQLTPTRISSLCSHDLALLGQHPSTAMYILLMPDLFNKLSEFDLGKLCVNHIEAAFLFLKSEKMNAKALRGILFNVHRYLRDGHKPGLVVDIVYRFFEDDLSYCLTANELNIFALNYPELAQRIIKNKNLSNKLSGQNLTNIALTNLSFMQALCKDSDLLARLTDNNLTALAQQYLFFAQYIFANQRWFGKLSQEQVTSIAIAQLPIAQHILANRPLFTLNEAHFFTIQFAHPALRATMYSKGDYLSTLPQLEMTPQEQKMYLSPQMQALVADETATDEDFDVLILQHSLVTQGFPSSIRFDEISKNNRTLPAILALLISPLKDMLYPDDLKDLCLFSEKAGLIILNDPTLYKKLNIYHLKDIAQHSLTYAQLILSNLEMRDDFSIEALTKLCARWAGVEKLLAQDPILKNRIQINFKLRPFIQEQAQYYAKNDLISDSVKKRSRKKY